MDLLTFLGLDYRGAPLIILYFVVLGISMPKIRSMKQLYHLKITFKKVKNQHV